jgi:transketolase
MSMNAASTPASPAIPRAQHDAMANAIRALAIDAVEQAKSGHPGMPMGCADMATVLFSRFLKFDPAAPDWADRDRFVLSAGHGSMLIYALLHLTGYPGMTIEELKRFRQLGSKTAGHPEYGHAPGVETTTGPLGQGLATAVGMALAERLAAARWSEAIVDHHTYVIASDGDLMEGVSQEAIAIAGHLGLSKLIVLFDDNGISIDGPLSLADSVDQLKRFESAGWATTRVDGHDPDAIAAAIESARVSDRPTLIACRTTIGFGAPTRAGTSKAHGEPLGAQEAAGAKVALGWTHAPFEIPADIRAMWQAAGARGRAAREAWEARLAGIDPAIRREVERRNAGEVDARLSALVASFKEKLIAEPVTVATRKASEMALEAIAPAVPELLLGSADLTGSNNTRIKAANAVKAGDFSGSYMHWGIREHGMAAAMNGVALHGGFIPAGGTFLVFSDYCRPAIRLAALMGVRAIYVFTHDSIGLGEDGPTHQPVEHLAALRAMPNLVVLRPADAIETAECWEIAIARKDGPTVLALTRQNLAPVRDEAGAENLSALGAYELAVSGEAPAASLFASGSEVAVAMEAQSLLARRGVSTRVVSVPSLDLLAAQPDEARASVIGTAAVRVGIEAGVRQGWDAILGADGIFVGMSGFGASAPARDLYRHFGVTAEAVAEKVLTRLGV